MSIHTYRGRFEQPIPREVRDGPLPVVGVPAGSVSQYSMFNFRAETARVFSDWITKDHKPLALQIATSPQVKVRWDERSTAIMCVTYASEADRIRAYSDPSQHAAFQDMDRCPTGAPTYPEGLAETFRWLPTLLCSWE